MRFTTLLFLLSVSATLLAQHTDQGVCGTPEIDRAVTEASVAAGKLLREQGQMSRGAVTYVPIRYKLIGKTDSSGAADVHRVLDLMTSINIDFEPREIEFYLDNEDGKPWDYYFNDNFYDDHAAQPRLLTSFKSSNAISIYVPNTATPPNSSGLGVTLGYFSPSQDILVFKRSEVGSNASTASHEIGHYFSLPHTFLGWDCCSWNHSTNVTNGCQNPEITSPVMQTTAPCSNRPVELVTRGPGANCATAGDGFCDTPADYNLGFAWNGCTYTGGVQDRNGDDLDPDENNFMGYFLGCNPYSFSDEQADAMLGNLQIADRSFLRGQFPDNVADVPEDVTWIVPASDNEQLTIANEVTLDWEPVPNAEFYYLEVSDSRSFRRMEFEGIIAANRTSQTVTGLEAQEEYFYRLRAFSQTSFGNVQASRSFTTGTVSGINNLGEAATALSLAPNPLRVNESLFVRIGGANSGEAQIIISDLTGREMKRQVARLADGSQTITVDFQGQLPAGTYLMSLRTDQGISTRKFSVN